MERASSGPPAGTQSPSPLRLNRTTSYTLRSMATFSSRHMSLFASGVARAFNSCRSSISTDPASSGHTCMHACIHTGADRQIRWTNEKNLTSTASKDQANSGHTYRYTYTHIHTRIHTYMYTCIRRRKDCQLPAWVQEYDAESQPRILASSIVCFRNRQRAIRATIRMYQLQKRHGTQFLLSFL
jgi:hypothetical protein